MTNNQSHRALIEKIYQQDLLDREERVMATLTGKHKHYCMDWDGMAIDETCAEFECCTCLSASALSASAIGERQTVDNGNSGGNSDG